MNAPVTRRALLGATAAVGAVALPASAAMLADPANLDVELFALLDRFDVARSAWDAAGDPFDEAMARARAAYPPRPDALWWKGADLCRCMGATATGKEPRPNDRVRVFYTSVDVDGLRAAGPVMRWSAVGDDHPEPYPREVDQTGEARRQEIIAAYDGWTRARAAVDDASGYTAAHAVVTETAEALNAAEEAVKLHQPRTVAGLVRKATWVADLLSRDAADDDLAEMFARQVAAFGGAAS